MNAEASALPANVGRLYPVAKAILGPLVRLGWRLEVDGLEHVPRRGPAIIAPNHISVLDSFLVPAVLPRRITYVGKAEYLDDWKTRVLFPAMGMIPIDRSGGAASEAAMQAAAAILARGELFGIYPEGTRSRDGRLHRGRTGAARLALASGAPLVPVGIRGTREVQPPGAPVPRPFMTVQIRIGWPIDPRSYERPERDPRVCRVLTDDVMYAISQLSGQEYVDAYEGAAVPTDPIAGLMDDRRTAAEALATAG